MALTEERIQIPEAPTPDVRDEPDDATWMPGWGWAVVVLGVLAVVALAIVVFRPDGDGTEVGDHQLVVENGSPRAVDAAATSSGGAGAHGLVVTYGSITAIDHAAAAGLPLPGPSTGNHGLVAENGSIQAVDHAAEASGS